MEKQLTLAGFPVKEKVYPLSISDKAKFIYLNMREKMPNLYNQIMKNENIHINSLEGIS